MNLPVELVPRYLEDPLGFDETVRLSLKLPADKYYTVSVWPVAGQVRLNGLNREVRAKKVSKSDQ